MKFIKEFAKVIVLWVLGVVIMVCMPIVCLFGYKINLNLDKINKV